MFTPAVGALLGGLAAWACASKKNKALYAVGGAVAGGAVVAFLTPKAPVAGAFWDTREVRDANKMKRLQKSIARKSEKLEYLQDLQSSSPAQAHAPSPKSYPSDAPNWIPG